MADLDFSSRAVKPAGLDFSSRAKDPSLGDEIVGAVTGAIDKLKTDAKADASINLAQVKRKNPTSSFGEAVDQQRRFGGLIRDAVGVVASPVTGLIHGAIVKPGADLLDKLPGDAYSTPKMTDPSTWLQMPHKLSPEERHASNENIINTGLGLIAPARAGVIRAAPTATRAAGMIERFDRAGVSPMLAAAEGKGAAATTNVIAENPVAGIGVRARLRRAVAQTETSVDALARRYGETRGPQITGENVQGGVNRYARDRRDPTSFAAKAGARYDKVFADIDAGMAGKTGAGTSQISTPATTAALQQINASTQSAAIGQLVADPTLSKVASTLSEAGAAKDMSFADLRRLRTWVRDAKKDPDLRVKIGDANLSRLEGSLTQDIYANADKLASPDLARQLRRTDQFYAAGQARIENALQSFSDAKSGESAYSRITQAAGSTSSADASKLLSLKRSLAPDEWGDVAANTISEMGRPAPGLAPAGETGFSVSRFVTRYNQLSPRGRDILFGAVGGGGPKAAALRAELDNLATVADDLKNLEKGANTSKTFVSAQTLGTGAGLLTPHSTLPTAGILSGMALTGEVMTNPVAVRWLVKLGRVKTPAALNVTVKQLRIAAQTNAALAPVYQETMRLLPSPVAATAAAEDQKP